jgi:hypothetical protein
MSKFNILVNKGIIGEEWLDALECEYYLFLSERLLPSPEQRTYIEECYNNLPFIKPGMGIIHIQ